METRSNGGRNPPISRSPPHWGEPAPWSVGYSGVAQRVVGCGQAGLCCSESGRPEAHDRTSAADFQMRTELTRGAATRA